MKRFFARISLALMATGFCTPAMAQTNGPQLAAVPSAPIVIGSIYWGTGFFVDRTGHVLTANHLIDDCSSIEIVGNGQREAASVVASDAAIDLGVLRVSGTFGEPVAFDSRPQIPGGAMVTILGYGPLGEALRSQGPAQRAVFNSMVLDDHAPQHIALISDANPGASGSPVVTRDGLVAGILQSKAVREGTPASAGQPNETRLALSGAAAEEFLRSNGITPIDGESARHARLAIIGELAAAEVKVECHR